MKTIAITGGKGGTGKSTVAVLLASKLTRQKKVLLVDLDVECPNDHLLVGDKLKDPIKRITSFQPEINPNLCRKCGKCVSACTSHALFRSPGKVPVLIADLCSACKVCFDVCPYGAIKEIRQETGQIFRHELNKNLTLITGQAKASLIETSPIVRETKETALTIARDEGFDTVILDTAAGTHCPVLVAMLGVDLAIAVTEPTPMGAHDLDLILRLLKKIGVNFEVCLNQYDLGNQKLILEVLKKHNQSKWQHQIPYSPEIVKAYSNGQILQIDSINF